MLKTLLVSTLIEKSTNKKCANLNLSNFKFQREINKKIGLVSTLKENCCEDGSGRILHILFSGSGIIIFGSESRKKKKPGLIIKFYLICFSYTQNTVICLYE